MQIKMFPCIGLHFCCQIGGVLFAFAPELGEVFVIEIVKILNVEDLYVITLIQDDLVLWPSSCPLSTTLCAVAPVRQFRRM